MVFPTPFLFRFFFAFLLYPDPAGQDYAAGNIQKEIVAEKNGRQPIGWSFPSRAVRCCRFLVVFFFFGFGKDCVEQFDDVNSITDRVFACVCVLHMRLFLAGCYSYFVKG